MKEIEEELRQALIPYCVELGYIKFDKGTVKNGKITCSFYTCVKAKPAKVSLKVTQSGKNFTLRRSVNGKVNYTCRSKY